jgi:hypothetical protein
MRGTLPAFAVVCVIAAMTGCHLIFPFNVTEIVGPNADGSVDGAETPPPPTKWATSLGGVMTDMAHDLAVDQGGNVYVTGRFMDTASFGEAKLTSKGQNDIFLVSFSPDGEHRWSRGFGDIGWDSGLAVAVDDSGNVVIAGVCNGDVDFGGGVLSGVGGTDLFVASFDKEGKHRWSRRIHGPTEVYGQGVAADSSGNVTVVGTFYDAVELPSAVVCTTRGAGDLLLVSYDRDGTHRWSRCFGSPEEDGGPPDDDDPLDVAVDSSGNVVIAGHTYGAIDFGGGPLDHAGYADLFVASFAPDGELRWSRGLGGPEEEYGQGVAADLSGNIYIAGSFYHQTDLGGGTMSSAGKADLLVVSLDGDGNHRWSTRLGSVNEDFARDVAIDPSGGVLVTGYYFVETSLGGELLQGAGGTDIFVVNLDDDGKHRWSMGLGSTSKDEGHAVAPGRLDDLFLVGFVGGPLSIGGRKPPHFGDTDGLLVRLSSP